MAEARRVKFAFAVPLQDAGEATRSLEIARGVRDNCPPGFAASIRYVSHGGMFAAKIRAAGFEIHDCEPIFLSQDWKVDLKTAFPELIGDPALVTSLIKSELAALTEEKPDVVVHGFWPSAGISRRALGIPGICFLPMPLHRKAMGFVLKDIPDSLKPLSRLPRWARRALLRMLPDSLKANSPAFVQSNIEMGARACGLEVHGLFEMLQADLTLVNDLPDFYAGHELPEGFRVVGPLFATADAGAEVDPEIRRVFDPAHGRPRILCAMGTSGTKEPFLEAVRALTSGPGEGWSSVILASPAVCPLQEVKALVGYRREVFVTDAFVPAPLVNAMADLVVGHGGHGTVQTALSSGTPIVGVAMQPEQQINLDNVVEAGAAIRIPVFRWKAPAIQAAVRKALSDPSYRANAKRLQQSLRSIDGRKAAAKVIWDFMTARLGPVAA